MVRRSSTTSRGTTYWFHCFCFPMSQLSALRMRNFSDLMNLPKSREDKVTETNEGKERLDPRSQPTRGSCFVGSFLWRVLIAAGCCGPSKFIKPCSSQDFDKSCVYLSCSTFSVSLSGPFGIFRLGWPPPA